jgi:hypothetical protein
MAKRLLTPALSVLAICLFSVWSTSYSCHRDSKQTLTANDPDTST